MPKYSYVARSSKGEREEGTLESESEFHLARSLKEQGLILISAKEAGKEKKGLAFSFSFYRRVSLMEKMMFTRNLRIMISAGIVLPRALDILSQQTKNKRFKDSLAGVKEEILKGNSFSDGLASFPDVFPELFSSMVKVGEEGGKLEEVLGILSRQMEREYELKSKIKGAMIYPAVVISAMIGIGIMMLVMVVPKISATFKEMNIPLPPTTLFIIWLGDTLVAKWYFFLLGILAFVFLLWRLSKTVPGKRIIDTVTIKIPLIAPILIKTNSAYTTRILGSLIVSGVPIARSLEILSDTLGNIHYKKVMSLAAEEVRKGKKISEVLINYKNIYPLLMIQMVMVGEETGKTSEILEKLADFFEDDVANATKNIASVVEPLIMLLIGGAIGFFAVSMVQPMYSMLEAIK